jgi:hypothetical protein
MLEKVTSVFSVKTKNLFVWRSLNQAASAAPARWGGGVKSMQRRQKYRAVAFHPN